MTTLDSERLRMGAFEHDAQADCNDRCGGDCGRCGGALEPREEGSDLLTRGLLDRFSTFIARGEPQADGDRDEAPADGVETSAMDEALARMESALGSLAAVVPDLALRLSSVEARVEEVESIEWIEADDAEAASPKASDSDPDADPDAVADSLKDRLEAVRRECDRLASVPIERVEARVNVAERTLGSLVERAEAAARACEAERRAAEGVCDRLESLATALTPWVELLELRETVDGLPKPMAAMLRLAGDALVREVSSVRGCMDRVAGVLGLPESTDGALPVALPTVSPAPDVSQVEGPMDPMEPEGRGNERPKGRPARAVRAKGADAETPRRTATQKRLAAEAQLRARTRAEGRPPRR